MEQYSLFQLNQFIRRVVSLNFAEPLWVRCEIFQVNISRGHYYIQLVQKDGDEDTVIARADAVLWQRQYQQLRRTLGPVVDDLLRVGLEVLLQVQVSFDERYGLQYRIDQIDPAFSLGKLEIQRQEAIQRLRAEGLIDKNASIPLPSVIQRIAVISSPEAAGFKDFLDQLHRNPYGYRFSTRLFPAAVQGQRVEQEVLERLQQIENLQDNFDCIAIIRGGGSRLDLAAFDQLELCRGVANCPLPIIAGIGHEIDETVLDLVAHTTLKTPTAVAEFALDHNAVFEATVIQAGARVGQLARLQIKSQNLPLLVQQIRAQIQLRLQRESQAIMRMGEQCALLDPQRVLERGYAFITRNGKSIRSAQDLHAGDQVRIHLQDGEAESAIQNIMIKP